MTWARKNVAVIVGWAVLLLGVAMAYGMQTAELGELRRDIDRQTAVMETKRTEMSTMKSDVRSLRERGSELASTVNELRQVVSEQRLVLARLEVLVSRLSGAP